MSNSDIETAVNIVRLAIAGAEALSDALSAAKKNLDDGTATLKELLVEIDKDRGAMHEQLGKDRAEADKKFDEKFDTSKDD